MVGDSEKEKEIMRRAIEERNVKFLCKWHFDEDISPLQEILIRKIAFQEHKKIGVCAMTRWGKSFCVSRGVALYLLMNSDKRIILLAPTIEQSMILRDYMADLVLKCRALKEIAHLEAKGEERLKQQASRSRQTFEGNREYRVFTAHGEAEGLMGHGLGSGGGILILDEACLIDEEARGKMGRMLGDNPENSMIIELFNPWTRDNKSFGHWTDPEWFTFHVGWKDAIEDGRTTLEFVESQRKELTPLEFTVLYDSEFPEESEDSVFNLSKINIAKKQDFGFDRELKEIEKKMECPHKMREYDYERLKEESKEYKKIISCDPADKGRDHTVIFWGIQKENRFQLIGAYSESKSESMAIVGKIMQIANDFIGTKIKGEIKIDKIGIGVGAFSRLKELIAEKNLKNIKVIGCHFGEKAIKEDNFINKKAENYFRAQALFNEEMIQIPDNKDLTKHLLTIKWELSSSSKKKIVDPNYSPDWADALVYFIWKDNKEMAFGFLDIRRR